MALIACPECGKQISETTPSCPHCGYQLAEQVRAASLSKTAIGALTVNKKKGISTVIGSSVILLLSPIGFAFFLIPGICLVIFSLIGIGSGINDIKGTYMVTCPYCNKESKAVKGFEAFKCPICKKHSVRKGEWLEPVN